MEKVLVGLLLFIVVGCAGSNPSSSGSSIADLPINAYGVKAVHKKIYKLGEAVLIAVENDSDSLAYLFQPNQISIQKLVDSTWRDLRIIYCPCGAPCAPPSYQPLEPYQILDLHWDQREIWCDVTIEKVEEQMLSKEIKAGVYRWLIKTNNSPEKDQVDDLLLELVFEIR